MSEKMRSEFEAWALANEYTPSHKGPNGEYIGQATAIAWEAWQASRSCLAIELPRSGYWGGYDQECYMEAEEVKDAIRDAGISIK